MIISHKDSLVYLYTNLLPSFSNGFGFHFGPVLGRSLKTWLSRFNFRSIFDSSWRPESGRGGQETSRSKRTWQVRINGWKWLMNERPNKKCESWNEGCSILFNSFIKHRITNEYHHKHLFYNMIHFVFFGPRWWRIIAMEEWRKAGNLLRSEKKIISQTWLKLDTIIHYQYHVIWHHVEISHDSIEE